MSLTEVLVSLAIAVGLVGIIVPILPGSVLVIGAITVWAWSVDEAAAWWVLVVAAALIGAGTVVKYLVPGRRLSQAGIPASTQWFGVLLGVVGFFVVPVIGLVIGFVLGVYLAEARRVGPDEAWPSTIHSLRAAGLSILIELVAALAATVAWVVGVSIT
ncbi:DUF456 domain-containing protein [Nocardioides sp.]|uniref:DUF456 domain-containing protein n=1 Tax=Nocardioides sp. TaxID=35761 RepID=UPI002EDAB6E5